MALQNLRSSTANKRPVATSLSDGQIAINTNAASPGIFFKNSSNVLTKVGPIQIGTSAPNSSPAGSAGNAVGEQWLDTSGSTVVLKVWNGSAWQQQNKFSAVAGTAAAPSIAFDGDPDSGLFSPGANQVAVATNGVGRLFVDASGNIQIKESSNAVSTGASLYLFDTAGAAGSGNSSGRICFYSSDSTDGPSIRSEISSYYENSSADAALLFKTYNGTLAERLRITAAGLVGIGTSSPGQKLHIVASSGVNNCVRAELSGTATYQTEAGRFVNTDTGTGTAMGLYVAGTDYSVYSNSGTNFFGGNVGIGSSTPSTILHIEKDTSSGAVGTYPEIRLDNDDANGRSEITFYDGATKRYGIFCYNGDGDLRFNKSSGETARMDASGRLLVGTSSARAKYFNTTAYGPLLNLEGTSNSNRILSFIHNDSSGAPMLVLGATGGSTAGSNTLISATGDCGFLSFQGADGSELVEAARIAGAIDGTPGANDMPGRLVFYTTADGASSTTERMRISSAGKLTVPGVYNGTTTGGSAVYVEADGDLLRFTSSRKYKTDIETIEDEKADAILECRPVWYRSLSQNDIKTEGATKSDWGWYGFIAEEVAEIDPRLVSWATKDAVSQEDGSLKSIERDPVDYEAEGVRYDNFVPLLLNLIKRQKEQIEAMEARLTALETA
jgi:hypothetical protein